MEEYNPGKIEKKWQKFWERKELFKARDFSRKKKFYLLVEFPYPSGEGLHVGHCRSYVGMDILARKKRMEGLNVLFPMGWDAFGLPTENYALQTGIHPQIATRKNTNNFKLQLKRLGLSFDWQREINTTDPNYYRWTQWIFLQLFKKGLAYKKKMPINWCPSCKIGLANEEVIEGKCERCSCQVTRKEKEQWLFKITQYAKKLLEDLVLVDYPEKVKSLQRDWIGRSEGIEIKFPIPNFQFSIEVFTTRIDTIFGATYLVLAPEHQFLTFLLKTQKSKLKNQNQVKEYIKKAKRRLERERLAQEKEKTGIKLEGIEAVNPANNKKIPIFVADYILPHYGTGAVMAVPCHDKRDFEFARNYNLPMIKVIQPKEEKKEPGFLLSNGRYLTAFEGEGVLINSERFNGLSSQRARERIFQWLARKGLAKKAIHYKLRDWVFSRQRYWGEPIPLVFCQECKKRVENPKFKKKFNQGELLNPGWIALPEKELPVKLPRIKDFQPTQEGQSPLAKVRTWLRVTCPKCGGEAQRETDVMPNWAGSNWYFLRYCDPENDKKLANPKKLAYWLPVNWYNGGMEHATLHLLYSRFIYKFLWDIGKIPKISGPEPYQKRTSHGTVLGEGGVKMSKSKGNVINPDEIVKKYGADTLRCYEMFMGPFEKAIAWDSQGVRGMRRFLERVWKLKKKIKDDKKREKGLKAKNQKLESLLHQTIKKVSQDIDCLKFNTALASLMVLVGELEKEKEIPQEIFLTFLILLSPFAPHLAEELYQKIKKPKTPESIFKKRWSSFDPKLVQKEMITLVIQINGKKRDEIEVERGISQKEVERLTRERPKIEKWLKRKKIKRVVFVKDRLVNFVVD